MLDRIIFFIPPLRELESSSISAAIFATLRGSSSVMRASRFEALCPSAVHPISLNKLLKVIISLSFFLCEPVRPVEVRALCNSSVNS